MILSIRIIKRHIISMPTKNTRPKTSGKRKKSTNLVPPGKSWLVVRRRPTLSITTIAFALLFVVVGGYWLYASSHAASGEEFALSYGSSKYCLDDYGGAAGAKGDPATVDVYTCNDSGPQQWNKSGAAITSAYHSNQCLDVYQGGHTNGTRVDLFPCGTPLPANQQWTYAGDSYGGQIIAVGASRTAGHNMCVDVNGYVTTPGRSLDLWQCGGGSNQAWNYEAYPGSSGGGGGSTGSCASGYEATVATAKCIGLAEMSKDWNPDTTTYVARGPYNTGQWANAYGTMSYWTCLQDLWTQESSWEYDNSPLGIGNTSAAYGIPQADPGSKMAVDGSDWVTNATTQIIWGVGYIKDVYGNPCGAWENEMKIHSYVIKA
jgi:ricin-type beta-trefoil lectin protein